MFLCNDRIENLQAFLKDLEAGNLEPYLKSEPIPTDNSGPVTVAVAKNFEDVITNNGKDTLIEFYAPWYVSYLNVGSFFLFGLCGNFGQLISINML